MVNVLCVNHTDNYAAKKSFNKEILNRSTAERVTLTIVDK
jgi:hypothetical protein